MKMDDSLEILYKQVQAICPVSDAAWKELSAAWVAVHLSRKQLLTRPGDVEKYIYFVLDGVQRAYIDHDSKEATLVFSYTHSFSGVIDSFFLQKPSRYYLETITRSTMLRIHYNDF